MAEEAGVEPTLCESESQFLPLEDSSTKTRPFPVVCLISRRRTKASRKTTTNQTDSELPPYDTNPLCADRTLLHAE